MEISYDQKTLKQKVLENKKIEHPDFIHIFVSIAGAYDKAQSDRFFILTKTQLQEICINHYSKWMAGLEWKRPRSPESYDLRFSTADLEKYEGNWELITKRLTAID